MTDADADAVASLIRAAFAAQSVPTDPPASALRVSGADVRAQLSEPGGGGAVVVASTQALAGAILWKPADGGLYVGRLSVAVAWRRRGVASRLLARADAEARVRGCVRIWLETRLVLADNRALFAAAGFVEISRHAHPGYVAPTFVRMEKRIG
ncbi:MAG: GNAT family N-acetyltransferase [Acetobacteraceae bacterium]